MHTPVTAPITVRRLHLPITSRIDPVIFGEEPETSSIFLAISRMLPYVEPYLIRSMQEAKQYVTSPALAEDLRLFCAQEGQHYRQHRRFNDAVRLPPMPALERLEAEFEADCQRFTRTRSLRFNLAYAEGFEAFTVGFALFCLEGGWLEHLRPGPRELIEWHLLEELEHRTVAFDVYEQVCGDYGYRVRVALFAQWHLLRFVFRATWALLAAQDAPGATSARPRGGLLRTLQRSCESFFYLLPMTLRTYLPWYTPRNLAIPAFAEERSRYYAELAAGRSAVAVQGPARELNEERP
ncbi:MAG: metal-dependent hydrolase [Myxococcales bacterium]